MSDFIQVVIKSDDDGHEFVIPAEKEARFDELLEQGADDYYEGFNDEFSQYGAGGAISIPLFARVGYESEL